MHLSTEMEAWAILHNLSYQCIYTKLGLPSTYHVPPVISLEGSNSAHMLSLSSSSSSHKNGDLPRLSLDFEKPAFNNNLISNPFAPFRMSIVKPKPGANPNSNNQIVDSGGIQTIRCPSMNSSVKIMFQSLEKCSSSFNGGPRK
ncbi:hypothetical protein V6N13_048439 [Hibiscus sabdariffa]